MRTTTTKIEVLLLPFQFLHFVQNVCNHCIYCILLWKKNERTQMVIFRLRFTTTKCASNEWC